MIHLVSGYFGSAQNVDRSSCFTSGRFEVPDRVDRMIFLGVDVLEDRKSVV